MRRGPEGLTEAGRAFLTERHLATLTTLGPGGRPHVVPVGFSWDGRTARVITDGGSVKARHARAGTVAVLCQVDGRRWLSLSGPASLSDDPAVVADAEARYAARYRTPRVNPTRVALLVAVGTILGSGPMLA